MKGNFDPNRNTPSQVVPAQKTLTPKINLDTGNLIVELDGADSAKVDKILVENKANITLRANPHRRNFRIWNDSTADVYIKHGRQCSTDDWSYKIASGQMYEPLCPTYRGELTHIGTAGSGYIRVTEEF